MDKKIDTFLPNIGLEYIHRFDGQPQGLPMQREALLTGEPVRQRVDELFSPQSLDQTLQRFVTPNPSDPTLLTPGRFEALVQDCASELQTLAEERDQPVLRQASQLLNRELQLRELFAHYRGTLMQG
jgi:hypothetical protein